MADNGVNVDSLTIQIEVVASNAKKEINDLSASIRNLGGVASKTDLQTLIAQMGQLQAALAGSAKTFELSERQMSEFREMTFGLRDALDGIRNETALVNTQINGLSGALQDSSGAQRNANAEMERGEDNRRSAINSFERLRGVLSRVSSAFGRQGEAAQAISKVTSRLSGETHGANNALTNMWHALVRIAKYRFLRTVIKEITQGIREGVTNLYQFAKATDGVFSGALDDASTSLQYMKNALATAIAPIIQALVPVLEKITSAIARIADFVSEILSAWNGDATYYSAMRVAKSFDEEAKSATKAGKAVRYLIAGFDELNTLPSKSASGVSSGLNTDYTTMFEIKPVSAGVSDAVSAVKDVVNELAGFLVPFGFVVGVLLLTTGHVLPGIGLIAASALEFYREQTGRNDEGKAVSDQLKGVMTSIAAKFKPLVAPMFVLGATLAAMGNLPAGFGLMLGAGMLSFYNVKAASSDDGASIWSQIQAATESLVRDLQPYTDFMIIAGIVLLATGSFLGGLALILGGGIVHFFGERERSSDGGASVWDEIKASTAWLVNKILEYKGIMLVAGIVLLFTGHFLSGLALIMLPEVLDMLRSEDGKLDTSDLEGKLSSKASEWLGILKTVSWIGLAVGVVMLFTPSTWLKGIALIVGSISLLNIQDSNPDSGNILTMLTSSWNGLLGSGVALAALGAALVSHGHIAVGASLLAAGIALGALGMVLDGSSSENQTPGWEYMLNPPGTKKWDLGNDSSYDDAINGAIEEDLSKYLLGNGTDNGSSDVYVIPETSEEWDEYYEKYKIVVPKRANGGFVRSGDLFFANENGKPEYVGSIGGETAVANNDQIVEGISRGVARALGAYVPNIITAIEDNRTEVNIGDDQIAHSAAKGNAAYRKQTGYSLPGLA